MYAKGWKRAKRDRGIYHVMLRGINLQDMWKNNEEQ